MNNWGFTYNFALAANTSLKERETGWSLHLHVETSAFDWNVRCKKNSKSFSCVLRRMKSWVGTEWKTFGGKQYFMLYFYQILWALVESNLTSDRSFLSSNPHTIQTTHPKTPVDQRANIYWKCGQCLWTRTYLHMCPHGVHVTWQVVKFLIDEEMVDRSVGSIAVIARKCPGLWHVWVGTM